MPPHFAPTESGPLTLLRGLTGDAYLAVAVPHRSSGVSFAWSQLRLLSYRRLSWPGLPRYSSPSKPLPDKISEFVSRTRLDVAPGLAADRRVTVRRLCVRVPADLE